MNLIKFLYLKELLRVFSPSKEQIMEFAIKNREQKDNLKLIESWLSENLFRINREKILKTVQNLKRAKLIIFLIAFFTGVATCLGLLSYSGKEPVNVINFLFIVFLLPLVSAILSLYSIFNLKLEFNFGQIIWRRVLEFFKNKDIEFDYIPKRVLALELNRVGVEFTIFFYVGFLVSFLLMVVGEDIAFGWRTTLNLSNQEFYEIVKIIALPWSWLIKGAVPTYELITQSHYFRLGGVDSTLIKSASLLGLWWKFLFMTTLFYGLILRLIVLALLHFKLKRVLKSELFNLDGVDELLFDIKSPSIWIKSTTKEQPLTYNNLQEPKEQQKDRKNFLNLIGWGFSQDEIEFFAQKFNLSGSKIYEAGGAKTIQEDLAVVQAIKKEAVVFIKSWEAPTMDFFDFIEELENRGVEVVIYPVGLKSNSFIAKDSDIKIWQDKLLSLGFKIKIKEPNNE